MKILVIEVAALGYKTWQQFHSLPFWDQLNSCSLKTVFPAVTCTVQASFRTAAPPAEHGMIANGFFNRKLRKTFFWEQASSIYSGSRIWDKFREDGGTVGQICWQQAIGNDSDLILTPAPIHKHHGGMIQDFHARPEGLYNNLCKQIGRKFNLFSYWGPFTSEKSTSWITDSTVELLKSGKASDFQLVYLPHLDYEMQKTGPDSPKSKKAFSFTEKQIEKIFTAAKAAGYEVLIFGDYAITEAHTAIHPNRILKDAGLFNTRKIKSMLYPDIYTSPAFAMVDHQIAHIYIDRPEHIQKVKDLFDKIPGVKNAYLNSEKIDHPASGEIILEADNGYWFAYPWWKDKSEAPDYATHVDIHSKPGFDPCELYMELWPPMSITTDTSKIKGTHGLINEKVFWGATFDTKSPDSILDGALHIKNLLTRSIK